MNFNIEAKVKGRYRMLVGKGDSIRIDTDWFDNLITDVGLDNMATIKAWAAYCSVGSSSTTPQFTDTQLGSRVATAQSPGSDGRYDGFRIDVENRYAVYRWTYTFPNGAAAGNLAELGVGPSNVGLNISSRARILDSGGTPTTITVLSDEDLVVVWEFFVKQPTTDFSDTLDVRTATTRAARVNAANGAGSWNGLPTDAAFNALAARSFTGAIADITSEPSGLIASSTSGPLTAYVPGSHNRSAALTWGAGVANGQIVRSIQWNFGLSAWQTEFDPPIPAKDNTQTLRVTVNISWGRDSGPA